MSLLDTKEKRKSFIITSVLMSILLLFFVFVSVLRELPEQESGIAINFGNTAVGSGAIETAQTTRVSPPTQPQPKVDQSATPVDNVATQDNTETVNVPSDPKVTNPIQPKQPTENTKPDPKPDPKPDQSVTDMLNSMTGTKPTDGDTDTGEGPGDGPGNKGDLDGNPYANTYYGAPGSGQSGRGAGLGGRKALAGKGAEPDCFETGTVIVEIHVNRSGTVTEAIPGKKGTTNRASCLLEAARKSALTYRFSPAPKAKDTQIGFVEVIFKVGE